MHCVKNWYSMSRSSTPLSVMGFQSLTEVVVPAGRGVAGSSAECCDRGSTGGAAAHG